jgi:hypothetical protein
VLRFRAALARRGPVTTPSPHLKEWVSHVRRALLPETAVGLAARVRQPVAAR